MNSIKISSLSIFFNPSKKYLELNAISKYSPVNSKLTSSYTFPLSVFEVIAITLSLIDNFIKLFFSDCDNNDALSILFKSSLVFNFTFELYSLGNNFL